MEKIMALSKGSSESFETDPIFPQASLSSDNVIAHDRTNRIRARSENEGLLVQPLLRNFLSHMMLRTNAKGLQ